MHILRERGRWCIKEEIGSVVVVIVPKASRAPRRRRRTRLVARPWRIMLALRITPRECRRFNCCNLLLDRNKTEENENDISSPRAPPCNCLVDNSAVVVHTKASSSIHRLSSAIVVQIPVSSLAQRVNQQMPTMTMHRHLNQLRYYAEHNPKTSTAILTFGTALSCGKMHIFISMTI